MGDMGEYKTVEDGIQMVEVVGGREAPNKTSLNGYISRHFKMATTPVTSTIARQLDTSPDDRNLVPTDTYGCLKSAFVADNCYIRPTYLRFALHSDNVKGVKGTLPALRELLLEKWRLKPPPLIILPYGDSFTHPILKDLVLFADKVGAWFCVTKHANQGVAFQSMLEHRQRTISNNNIVYWENWANLTDEERGQLKSDQKQIDRKEVYVSDWQVTTTSDHKQAARQASCFLFPDYKVEEGECMKQHIDLVSEFSKEFDHDGHGDIFHKTRDPALHVCSVVNLWVSDTDIEEDTPQEKKDLLRALILSGIPTVFIQPNIPRLGYLASCLGEDIEECFKDEDQLKVVFYSGQSEHIDLSSILIDLLVSARQCGLSNDVVRKKFEDSIYTELYLSMRFGDVARSRGILEACQEKGTREHLINMIYFYKNYKLLGSCIRNGRYDANVCLYGTLDRTIIYKLAARCNNSLTKQFRNDILKNDKRDKLQILLEFIYREMDQITSFEDYRAEQHWILYLYYCLNEEWELAKLIRRYSEYPVLKCLLAIKVLKKMRRLRNNTVNSNTDDFDIQQIDQHICEVDAEARDIIAAADKEGLDVGPVVFHEHKVFSDYSILSLADEIHSVGVYEDITNVRSYITRRWNGALDPLTSTLKIVLSWLTLGLIAPAVIDFVPKKDLHDEAAMFLNEKGAERSYCDKWVAFWNSPRSKCYLLMITYLVFLYLLTRLVLDNSRPASNTVFVWVTFVFVLAFLFTELNLKQVDRSNIRRKLRSYLKSGYNKLDLFSAALFLLFFLMTIVVGLEEEAVFFTAKICISLSYIGYIVRFTQFLQMFEQIGPKLITIKRMLSDLAFFACFLLLNIFAYGIVSEFLLHPYPRSVGTYQILEILKRPYVNMFGELDLDTFEEAIAKGVCKYETSQNATLASLVDCEDLAGYQCDARDVCVYFKLIARVLLGVYTMTTVILLTNLLVSIFSKTYDKDYDKTQQLWQIQRFKLVKEFEDQFALPFPPFNLFYSLYNVISRVARDTSHGHLNSFYIHHTKEVEVRASKLYYRQNPLQEESLSSIYL